MKTIVEFEVIDHGVEHEQYFQGCGVLCTQFTDVATGIGDSVAEAIEDALGSLAQDGWGTEGMEKRICKKYGKRRLPSRRTVKASQEECHHYVSIRVKE